MRAQTEKPSIPAPNAQTTNESHPAMVVEPLAGQQAMRAQPKMKNTPSTHTRSQSHWYQKFARPSPREPLLDAPTGLAGPTVQLESNHSMLHCALQNSLPSAVLTYPFSSELEH